MIPVLYVHKVPKQRQDVYDSLLKGQKQFEKHVNLSMSLPLHAK